MDVVTVPKLGQTMESAVVERWLVKEGDFVKKGDVILEITTDKATLEVESYVEGTVLKILANEGEEKAVGEIIAVVGEPGEEVPSLEELKKRFGAPEEEKKEEVEPSKSVASTTGKEKKEEAEVVGKRVKASPRAKRLAAELGVSLEEIEGTGPGGRITEDDVRSFARKKSASIPQGIAETVEPSRMRAVIAERMAQSKSSIPHFYLQMEVDMRSALRLKESLSSDGVTLTHIIVKACADALVAHPEVNVAWVEGKVGKRDGIHVGVAVSVDGGLVVPVVRNADGKSLVVLAAELRELVEKARNNRLMPDETGGASMTVSNLGTLGISSFYPIINPGESVILGCGTVEKRPVVGGDGKIGIADMMSITLSCDHRLIDGAEGARFLGRIKELLEHPERLQG